MKLLCAWFLFRQIRETRCILWSIVFPEKRRPNKNYLREGNLRGKENYANVFMKI